MTSIDRWTYKAAAIGILAVERAAARPQTNSELKMILKSLRTIVPVVLLVVASSSAVDARPIVFGKPYKINMETGKASCLAMDGVFRYASGGGFTCTMYGPEAEQAVAVGRAEDAGAARSVLALGCPSPKRLPGAGVAQW